VVMRAPSNDVRTRPLSVLRPLFERRCLIVALAFSGDFTNHEAATLQNPAQFQIGLCAVRGSVDEPLDLRDTALPIIVPRKAFNSDRLSVIRGFLGP